MPPPLRILSVVGARPQFIKAAAMDRAFRGPFSGKIAPLLLHTGQHQGTSMSDIFFEELGLAPATIDLVQDDPQASTTIERMAEGVERALRRLKVDVVLVHGDTNSTLAGAMAAAASGIPLAHVEAGLRSFDTTMPEEVNRLRTDQLSTWLFCPTQSAMENLEREGFMTDAGKAPGHSSPRVLHVGDVMLDNTRHFLPAARRRGLHDLRPAEGGHIVATIHRADKADDLATLQRLFHAFHELSRSTGLQVIVPLHPRTAGTFATLRQPSGGPFQGSVRVIAPLGYLDMMALVDASRLVITDSGGLQKEAAFLGRPCLILRDRTEWVELLASGCSVLVGTDPDRILAEAERMLERSVVLPSDYGDGHAAERICAELLKRA